MNTSRTTALLLEGALALALALGAAACSDDTEQNNGTACADGESLNPVTGECVVPGENNPNEPQCLEGQAFDEIRGKCWPIGLNNDDNNTNNDTPDAGDDPDTGDAPDAGDEVDMAPPITDPCDETVAELDWDNDGLLNACECSLGSDPNKVDSDDDGLTDAEEDANSDCRAIGETDPRSGDTDGDGVPDKVEVETEGLDPLRADSDDDDIPDGVEFAGCSDPTNADSDGDGIPDGTEDSNWDGEIGVCPNRTYEPGCAEGESDPCKEDTDGDGTLDPDEVIYRECRPEDTMNLPQPQLITSANADYQLALEPAATATIDTAALTSATGTVEGHAFEELAFDYTGFVVELAPASPMASPNALADEVFAAALRAYPGATRRNAGRQIQTHDGFAAIVDGTVDLPPNTAPEAARRTLLAELTGLPDVTDTLAGAITPDAARPTLMRYALVSRSASEYILVATFTPEGAYEDDTRPTGWRVDDLAGGTPLATANEQLSPECVSYKVLERAQVDIIVAVDGSGSMSDERNALASFSTDLVNSLNAANLDWRVGVTGVACDDIQTDMDISAEFKALWPAMNSGCEGIDVPFPFPIPNPTFGLINGQLVGGGFTDNAPEIARRVGQVSTDASEFSATMAAAAVDRALPRADGLIDKIRPNAAVVLIVVTDEEDELFEDYFAFLPHDPSAGPLDPANRMQMETLAQGFVDYLLKPEIGATMFGLYNVPGDPCMSAAEYGYAIDFMTGATGGSGGSICQANVTTTLQSIADATAGLASALRLLGTPVAPSIEVLRANASTGNLETLTRSRDDGYDYDGTVNRIAFYGPNPPQTGDRVVIPYLRWENSVFTCTMDTDCPGDSGQKLRCIDNQCR
jgi:hypothetical protein